MQKKATPDEIAREQALSASGLVAATSFRAVVPTIDPVHPQPFAAGDDIPNEIAEFCQANGLAAAPGKRAPDTKASKPSENK